MMRTQEQDTRSGQRITTHSVNSAGIPYAFDDPCTVVKIATGQYMIYVQGIKAVKSAIANIYSSAGMCYAMIAGGNAVQVNTFNGSWAATDNYFTLTVTGLAK